MVKGSSMDRQRSLFHDSAPTFDEIMSVWGRDREFRSRKQIAEALGRAKSPTMLQTLGILVGSGYLTIRVIRLPNGADLFEYAPTPKWEDDGSYKF